MFLKSLQRFTVRLYSKAIFSIALIFSLLQFSINVYSQCSGTATFTGSGTYKTGGGSSSTFTGNPTTACTIIIPSGITINITSNITWIGNVQIAGTLVLSNQLNIGSSAGCGLEVILQSGGTIKDDASGGGASERLIICGKTILTTQPTPPPGAYQWPTPAGTGYTGPGSIGENFTGVLPIELLYFDANNNGLRVTLNWATSTESNFDYFGIERSNNGTDFQSINSLEGIGGKYQLTKYSYTDALEQSGRYYYRLKSVDLDRSFEYSKIISVTTHGFDDTGFIIYPNPAINDDLFYVDNTSIDQAQLILIDQLGKSYFSVNLKPGKNEIPLEHSIPNGMYFVKFIGNNRSETEKLIIAR